MSRKRKRAQPHAAACVLRRDIESTLGDEGHCEAVQKIINTPPLTRWVWKWLMRRSLDADFQTVQDLCANASGIFTLSQNAQEARRAFVEKGTPVFKGG